MTANRELRAGCAAYWDTFAGLVPVRVDCVTATGPLGLQSRPSSDHSVRFTVTRDHGPYKAGEVHESWALDVVPPGALIRRCFDTRIGAYTVRADSSS